MYEHASATHRNTKLISGKYFKHIYTDVKFYKNSL